MSDVNGALVAAAAVFGLTSSVHCAAMCGPLALSAGATGAGASLRYHVARAAGYSALGGVLGGLGAGAEGVLGGGPGGLAGLSGAVPLGAAMLVALQAAGVTTKVAALPGVAAAVGRAARVASRGSPAARAAALGALTPVLPCGLLLGMYALAAASGSAAGGAASMAAFALGTTPLLLGAQLGWGALMRGSLSRHAPLAQRAALVAAAITLAWRGWAAATGAPCHLP
jgi:uncharacterized protein